MNKNNLKLIKGAVEERAVEERAVEEKAVEEGGIRKIFMKEQGGKFLRRTGSEEIFMKEQRGKEKNFGDLLSQFVL